jgi:hypothetical protein
MFQHKGKIMSTEAKCSCQHCNGHIAFPTEMAGQMLICPHCGMETKLLPPALQKQVEAQATKTVLPKNSRLKLPLSQTLAIFFACTTFCLAFVLFWEHHSNSATPASNKSSPAAIEKAQSIQGSDTITVWWGGDLNKVRLDECNFERNLGVFYVRLKSNGKLVGQVSGAEAEKVQAYLYGK